MERDRRVVGIVTEADIVRKVLGEDGNGSAVSAEHIMTAPVIAINGDRPITEAADHMDHHRRCLVYRSPALELSLAIHQEVIRAVG